MENRLRHLIGLGLRGIEAFYSGFSPAHRREALALAKRFDLYVTAGSDYHGTNKLVLLGDTGLPDVQEYPEGLRRFLETVRYEPPEPDTKKEKRDCNHVFALYKEICNCRRQITSAGLFYVQRVKKFYRIAVRSIKIIGKSILGEVQHTEHRSIYVFCLPGD